MNIFVRIILILRIAAILNSFFRDNRTEASQTQALQRFIVENRTTPGLIMMVTHQVNITALTGIFPQSGEVVLVKANDAGQVKVVGRFSGE
ncbi:MAG TPA: hypothetical protein IGS53_29235 [Leptolyngbyaceae cyanobacterium M33_DOE_097]|uniref:Histidine phosphatase family protein n=1 Tax=Oscillatoriales cyanobacterium SpSt-418 TaxID=2282169 RepID=A0A7C3KDR1_9CYAN|nr:hypothetical protein [Leptolyngbyaceae cyanobacterium M33_DOE_097]